VVAAQRQACDRRGTVSLRTCGVMDESSLVLASVVGVGDGGLVNVPARVLPATARASITANTVTKVTSARCPGCARTLNVEPRALGHEPRIPRRHPDTLTCRISTKTSPRRPMAFDVGRSNRWLMLWNPARPLVLTDLMAIGYWCGDSVFTAAC